MKRCHRVDSIKAPYPDRDQILALEKMAAKRFGPQQWLDCAFQIEAPTLNGAGEISLLATKSTK